MHGSAPLASISTHISTSYYLILTSALLLILRFAESDALWAGLVRGVYLKTEERITAGKMELNKKDKCFESTDNSKDFKREWRVKRAKMLLIERFGLPLIRRAIAYAVVVFLVLVALIVVEATRTTHIIAEFQASVASSIETAFAVITGLVASVTAIVPSFKLAFASNKESNASRGDVLFKEAKMVKDQLGFLAKVKGELQELFTYLREFEEKVGTRIVLVPIIDDLDRCITDGRNVKVLEAMQLILSVPGAPILSFLAVDSRIVVASIEEHYAKVFAETNISGYEYLDKIVQLPFALPEPSSEKVERLLSKSLEGDAASPEQVAQRLKAFGTLGSQILAQTGSNQITFKTPENELLLEPLILVINKFPVTDVVEMDSKQALKLVCEAARMLGTDLKESADKLTLMDQTNVYKEEAVEILCRQTNSALEAGKFGFEKVLYT